MKLTDRIMIGFLAAIFLFSGLDKIFHYQGFVNALRDYVLVPRGTAPYFSMPLIGVELLVGVGLLLKPWRRQAALTAAGLLALFTLAIALNYHYGGRGICGCWFTITLSKSTGMHLAQNILFFCLALQIWMDARAVERRQTPAPAPS